MKTKEQKKQEVDGEHKRETQRGRSKEMCRVIEVGLTVT